MTLEQVRDRLRSECAHVEKDENKYPECAYTTPAWLLGDLADDLDAIIESALAPRVMTGEDVMKLGDDYFRLVKEAGQKGMAGAFWVKPLRAALEAYERNRK